MIVLVSQKTLVFSCLHLASCKAKLGLLPRLIIAHTVSESLSRCLGFGKQRAVTEVNDRCC